jgi:ATP-dependent protease ClpP protease subunit
MRIFTKGNHIHFNEKITKQSVIKLIEEIETVNEKIAKMKQEFHTTTQIPILLYINSWGGCLDSALGVCNIIENNKNPIITIINGQSASAGTMLSIVGHKRLIYPASYAMVHEGSSYVGGDNQDIDDDIHNMEVVEDIIKELYLENTVLTSKEYDELCINDKIWRAEQCYKYGLVDIIIDDPNKLQDWNWLLSISTHKRKTVSSITQIRKECNSVLKAKKAKLST